MVKDRHTDRERDIQTENEDAGPRFANESEREFARILDFYQINWQYEPHTFPIAWDENGRPVESFSPDFYLPDLDLHIELTTLKQSLVTKKNRKLRLLRQYYPHVNIKLLYGRDFRSLMIKYGLSRQGPGARDQARSPALPAPQREEPTLKQSEL